MPVWLDHSTWRPQHAGLNHPPPFDGLGPDMNNLMDFLKQVVLVG